MSGKPELPGEPAKPKGMTGGVLICSCARRGRTLREPSSSPGGLGRRAPRPCAGSRCSCAPAGAGVAVRASPVPAATGFWVEPMRLLIMSIHLPKPQGTAHPILRHRASAKVFQTAKRPARAPSPPGTAAAPAPAGSKRLGIEPPDIEFSDADLQLRRGVSRPGISRAPCAIWDWTQARPPEHGQLRGETRPALCRRGQQGAGRRGKRCGIQRRGEQPRQGHQEESSHGMAREVQRIPLPT